MDLTQLFTGLNFDGQYLDIAGRGLSGCNPLSNNFTSNGFLSSRWRP